MQQNHVINRGAEINERSGNACISLQFALSPDLQNNRHPDVRFFAIKDNAGTPIAYFYLDPYSRPAEKRGGAWMDEVVGRSRLFARDGKPARLPVAHMVCNGTPPVGGKPSLMTFREVETLFHEAGHALQHMLTRVDEGLVAGIRGVEWDAVELPSQVRGNEVVSSRRMPILQTIWLRNGLRALLTLTDLTLRSSWRTGATTARR